jgi:hypothetical protein
MSEPVATAPVVPTLKRNRLGIAALILVLIAIALPVLTFVVTSIAAGVSGGGGDAVGWGVLGGFVFAAVAVALVSPIAIIGVVLGIIAVTRPGLHKVQGIVAIVVGVVPALAVFGIPAAIDTLF